MSLCSRLLLASLGWLIFPDFALGQPAGPVEISDPRRLQAVRIAGETWLVFEFVIEDTSAYFRLPRQTVRQLVLQANGKRVVHWREDELAARLDSLSGEKAAAGRPVRAPALLFVELVLPAGVSLPTTLTSSFSIDDGEMGPGSIEVDHSPVPSFGPPLRGGPWAALTRNHRRTWFREITATFGNSVHIPGRFAFDWVKLDDRGRLAAFDAPRAADHFGYRDEVLAVADATVVSARGHLAEVESVSSERRPLDEASGNFLSLDLGGGRYVHYGHLRPESLRVKVGDRVKRGQVIAELGYSGESTGPQLHLHVSDGATPLAGQGLPYVFERWEWLGQFESLEKFGRQAWAARPSGQTAARHGERPRENAVVAFP